MRQIFGDIGWEKKLLVFFGALIVLTLLGPFGTYADLDFWSRFVFWVMIVGGVGFCMHVTMTVGLKTPLLGRMSKTFRLLISAALGALPGAAIVVFVNAVFRPPLVSADGMPVIWLQVTVIGFIIGVVEYMDWRVLPPAEDATPVVRTKLHDRFRSTTTADIISMSMQDHYVEVTTSAGKELVLSRFADAIDEVKGVNGLRLHRSHWIAEKHLVDTKRRGNRAFAKLSDGRELPVSDTYLKAVEATIEARTITS
ncbi:LytTR family DNA-binding domain-containing protein [Yoonia litorea]|uniref:Transcriptional regulator, LytTR family n=1 Tax=Yoonia litorea TaxID=1123755 RepID=A0A1I6MLH0_9RHOB|nr:LytTR family DNA-binding domain-containing protein [Yoonia litorea]SFS16576.1 transcriptional regulator, LytTR family [Yoonia litorea]